MKSILKNLLKKIGISKNNIILNIKKDIHGLKITNNGFGFIFSFISKNFISFVIRPIKSIDNKQISTYNHEKYINDFGILIQGTLGKKEEKLFLLETIKLYLKIFPSTKIVLSTWSEENSELFENLSENLYLIKSTLPKNKGWGNINLQIKSTYEGAKYFEKLKIKNILKTRTDCRLNKPNLVPFFLSLQKNFPSDHNNFNRIFVSSIATCKFRVYGITDILLYGPTEDLLLYFKNEEENEILKNYGFQNKRIHKDTALVSEILLCARYLSNKGVTLDWTLDHWWFCLKEYFGIIDVDSIDFFWNKYEWHFEKRFLRNYGNKSSRCVEFVDWLALYNNHKLDWQKIEYKETFELKDGKILKKTVV